MSVNAQNPFLTPKLLLIALVAFALPHQLVRADQQAKSAAYTLHLTGKHAEAYEAFSKLEESLPVAAAIGKANARLATGQRESAVEILEKALKEAPADSDLNANLANLAFDAGEYEAAQKYVDSSLDKQPNHLQARWLLAELHRVHGRLDKAQSAYEWFIDYYNDTDDFVADDIRYIGLAAAQYARWTRDADHFAFFVNDLYPDALTLDKNYWPAHLETARLFLEKYNLPAAGEEVDAVLAINPNSAEAHCLKARLALDKFNFKAAEESVKRALRTNPAMPEAQLIQASILLQNWEYDDAIKLLKTVRERMPKDEVVLGMLAAAYGSQHGFQGESPAEMQAIINDAVTQNEHCGLFFVTLAETIDGMRKFPYAVSYYQEALKRMPQLLQTSGQLGMLQMRLGDEAAATKLLEKSFEDDPFNVRIKNTLEVLDVLQGYAVIETDHFVIKFDRGRDEIFAQYAADLLENQVYPDLVKTLGYEPPEKSLFEFFSRAKQTSGHGWFSARMVGLPSIGTVGACAGRMVAMVSPNDMPKKFNWGRVLQHEFVHVLNLQQTNFNIPHWFTEALAVHHERMPRPSEWNQILVDRSQDDDLFNLSNINHGFIRPKTRNHWTLAYCQSELYADFMVEKFGEDALAKMLKAYADNLSTAAAIQECFQVDIETFEEDYSKYVADIVREVNPQSNTETLSLAELQKRADEDPENASALAALADMFLKEDKPAEARKYAMKAIKLDRHHQRAVYVLAKAYLSIGDSDRARVIVGKSLDESAPDPKLLSLRASLHMKAGEVEEATKLYELGERTFPNDEKWLRALSGIYLKSNNPRLAGTLEKLAAKNADNTVFRKKLASLALEDEDYQSAAKWANQAIQIDVLDSATHVILAQASAKSGNLATAAKEYEVALKIDPGKSSWKLALAKVWKSADNGEKALKVARELLDDEPNNTEAKELIESLESQE